MHYNLARKGTLKEEMDEYMIYLKGGKIFKHTLLFDQED